MVYHALINALSTHMIHINLNMIFYTHVEHSPTKTIYIKYFYLFLNTLQTHTHTNTRAHTHTYTDCSRNWVLILVRMEILWEEGGFQFGFKRWGGKRNHETITLLSEYHLQPLPLDLFDKQMPASSKTSYVTWCIVISVLSPEASIF